LGLNIIRGLKARQQIPPSFFFKELLKITAIGRLTRQYSDFLATRDMVAQSLSLERNSYLEKL
jgi:hypothetical protein